MAVGDKTKHGAVLKKYRKSAILKARGAPYMPKNLKTPSSDTESFCRGEIERMLKYSQTKVIMPVVTLGLLRVFLESRKRIFSDPAIKRAYEGAVKCLKEFLGHEVHIGAKYYDAYGTRMSRYSVLRSVGRLKEKLLA